MNYLLSGLKEGLDTGIKSIPQSPFICKDLNSALNDMDAVDLLLKKEVDKGFVIGPFDSPIFPNFRINPLGVAVRTFSDKKRLIVDFSAPHDNKLHPSINSLIEKDEFSLTYVE